MEKRANDGWNPYLAGALTGLLIVASAYATGNFFGASGSFVRAAGTVERAIGPGHFAGVTYFARYLPRLDWQGFFLIGVTLGSLAAALVSRDFAWGDVPAMWASRFGPGRPLRAAAAFAGGFVMLVGARIAGG
ncbi:MAG TPA: YeeE/YedE thiosulfate transporter family protein [bacterium]